jgi:hypothetical protein
MKNLCFLLLLVALVSSCTQQANDPFAGQWIDLSHDFGDDTVYWVTAEPFKRTTVSEGKTDGGLLFRLQFFRCGTWRNAS